MGAAPSLHVGQVLDEKYRIDELVGHGGMGTVYRARHLALGAPRAIKVVRRELAEDPTIVERFRHEALLAESLRHPNLVSLYDFSSLPDGTPYIVWEYVEGETISKRIAYGRPFTPLEVVDLVGQVADGLAAAHRRGIVHRDISPDNIIVSEAAGIRVAKVLDFGIAKIAKGGTVQTTGSGLFLGKIGYSSPEQMGLLAESEVLDSRTDVFSLGVVAYLMLTGRLPFRSGSVNSYFHDVVVSDEGRVQASFLEQLSEPWCGVFRRAIARNRDQRTPSMGALKAELLAALENSSAEAIHRLPERSPVRSSEEQTFSSRETLVAPPLDRWRSRRVAASVATLVGAASLFMWLFERGPFQSKYAPPNPEPRIELAPSPSAADGGESWEPESSRSIVALLKPSASDIEKGRAENDPIAPPVEEPRRYVATNPESTPRTGKLVLSATPEASVAIDGRLVGITPMDLRLDAGAHEIVFSTPDGLRWRGNVQVAADEVLTLHRRLDIFGSITVSSDVWAEVSLDGGAPEQTPIVFPRVGVGLHELRAFRDGYHEKVLEVRIEENDTTTVSITMEKKP